MISMNNGGARGDRHVRSSILIVYGSLLASEATLFFSNYIHIAVGIMMKIFLIVHLIFVL